MSSGQKVACYHLGEEFDWWRCNVEGWVGRPPSPFPASFEHAHLYRESSADQRACVAGPPPCCPSGCCGAECKCEGCDGQALDEASRKRRPWGGGATVGPSLSAPYAPHFSRHNSYLKKKNLCLNSGRGRPQEEKALVRFA
ncbi:hypothetical protein Btru_028077 [Bulinus truncatus]|nr:hypothetical protein Btru_028077 [Bulinus truncatus]